MNLRIISALLLKDLKMYFSNQFFAVITGLGLVAYIVIFFLLPKEVDEELELGLYMSDIPPVIAELLEDEEINFTRTETDQELQDAVFAGDIPAGYSFPDGALEKITRGENAAVNLYFSSDIPEEFKEIYAVILDEFAYRLSGQMVDIETTEYFMGPDMAGEQIPPRAKLLPMLTIMVLIMEMMGLASLIATEVQTGTLKALLITPLKVNGLFVAKGLFGTLLAFVQVALLMAVTGGLSIKPGLILLTLLIGSLFVTGIGFFLGSISKDLMSVIGWSFLGILILMIPSFSILIPGIASDWIQFLPSFYLVDTAYRVLNFGAGWPEVGLNLVWLFLYAAAFMVLGSVILRRKFQ